jgi:hypothetical protein
MIQDVTPLEMLAMSTLLEITEGLLLQESFGTILSRHPPVVVVTSKTTGEHHYPCMTETAIRLLHHQNLGGAIHQIHLTVVMAVYLLCPLLLLLPTIDSTEGRLNGMPPIPLHTQEGQEPLQGYVKIMRDLHPQLGKTFE